MEATMHYMLSYHKKITSAHKKRLTIIIKNITSHGIEAIRQLSLKIIAPTLIPIENSNHPMGAE